MNYSHIQQITIVIHIVWFFLVFIRCVFTELQLCFGQCLKLHSLWIQALQCFSFDRQFFFLLGWFTGSCWTVRAGTDRTTTSGRIGFLAYRNGLFQDERSMKTSLPFSQSIIRLRTLKILWQNFGGNKYLLSEDINKRYHVSHIHHTWMNIQK